MDNLESKIRFLNREILNLKTSAPLGSAMKTFYAEYELNYEGDEKIHTYEITYADSSQPIMTAIYCDNSDGIVAFAPNGNKQIISDTATAQIELERIVLFCSSRQILGIRKLT